MIIHTVKSGDTLYNIARTYGATVAQITADNQLENLSYLIVGQALYIRTPAIKHTVVSGDTLYKISLRYGVTLGALIAANPSITDPSVIYPGQVINIPSGGQKTGIVVNGYTAALGGSGVSDAMPNLTYISPFSREVNADGTLKTMNDTAVLASATAAGVGKLMTITNMVNDLFNSDIAHAVLTDTAARDRLFANILAALRAKNYDGLNVDFEYVYPADRESYNSFLRELSKLLRDNGFILVTAVAPKISGTQAGTLYEAHDYPVHGEVADYVVIMTYEWGYTYGPAMAVSPVGPVKQVLDYAVKVIPPRKILMGMPNYGYDWTLPFKQGTAASGITNTAAVAQAARVGASIKYDTTQQAPYYNYYDASGKQHEVWFEDVRSMEAKLRLVSDYGLAGISWWNIDSVFRQGQLALTDMYTVKKI